MRARRIAAALTGSVVLAAGFASPAGAQPPVERTLTCAFPSGPGQASLRAREDGVELTLPAFAGVASVAGTVRFPSGTAEIPATPVPASGDLVLVASGNPGPPGDLELSLNLSTMDGTPADPPSVSVPCTLNPEPGPSPSAPSAPAPTKPAPAPTAPVPPRAPRVAAAPIPPECGVIPVPPGGKPGCAFVTGYTTVRKLGASVLVVPALANVAVVPPKPDGVLLKADNPTELIGGRIPPLTATFLAFGFVPIKATMDLVQDGPITIHTEGRRQAPFTFTVTTIATLAASIHDVSVNGVPLDVGPNCHTAKPIAFIVNGGTPDYVNVLRGGPQAGFVDIPSFTGCGVTENLDPLLTGTVSGPGNRVKTIQGSVCSPPDQAHTFCPPVAPALPPPGSF